MTLMKFLHISQVVATIVAYFFQLLGKPFVWLLGSCHGHMLCWDWSSELCYQCSSRHPGLELDYLESLIVCCSHSQHEPEGSEETGGTHQ